MRSMTAKEQEVRARHPNAELVVPSSAWRLQYMEAIDQGWHDYDQESQDVRDPEAFAAFVERINSGKSWDGEQECVVRWLVDAREGELLGRARLKNIHVPMDDPLWSDPMAMIEGHVGYAICPASRGRGYGTLILSLALDECWAMGLKECICWIDDDNEASMRATMGCGAARGRSMELPDGNKVSAYSILLFSQEEAGEGPGRVEG